MKTKLQILQETADYYSADPSRRAVSDGSCFYWMPCGKKCAIGRVAKHPKALESVSAGCWMAEDIINEFGDKLFKPEYRGHEEKFWTDLQRFHDLPRNWTTTGLSSQGRRKLQSLKKKYQ